MLATSRLVRSARSDFYVPQVLWSLVVAVLLVTHFQDIIAVIFQFTQTNYSAYTTTGQDWFLRDQRIVWGIYVDECVLY